MRAKFQNPTTIFQFFHPPICHSAVVLTYSFQMKMMYNGLKKAADKLTLMILKVKSEFFGYIGLIFGLIC